MAKKYKLENDLVEVRHPDKFVVLEIKDPGHRKRNRIVQFNLDDKDDWFEIACGTSPDGKGWAEVGNDEDHRWPVVRAFELVPDDEMYNGSCPTAQSITLLELNKLVMERIEKYSG